LIFYGDFIKSKLVYGCFISKSFELLLPGKIFSPHSSTLALSLSPSLFRLVNGHSSEGKKITDSN
jgi:hypothetical protein